MAVTGIHTLLYTDQPDELRATLRDVFGFDNVDAGGGWLIFKLPPAEMGIHPSEGPEHQVSMMCDDIQGTIADLRSKGIEFIGEPLEEEFGITIMMRLPGIDILLYEPRHPTAI